MPLIKAAAERLDIIGGDEHGEARPTCSICSFGFRVRACPRIASHLDETPMFDLQNHSRPLDRFPIRMRLSRARIELTTGERVFTKLAYLIASLALLFGVLNTMLGVAIVWELMLPYGEGVKAHGASGKTIDRGLQAILAAAALGALAEMSASVQKHLGKTS